LASRRKRSRASFQPTQPDVIDRILIHRHCGLEDELARGPPKAASPAISKLQYVSDVQYANDPGPQEHAWSADCVTSRV
jgi:hypothetical protein